MLFDTITYEKPLYNLLKIKPDSRLTNTSYESIINVIHSTYKNIQDRVHHVQTTKYNGLLQYETIKPITYEILFDGDNKQTTPIFYLGVPNTMSQYLKQRIQAIMPNSTITFEEDLMSQNINKMFSNCYVYEYHYASSDILSLKTKENNLLESILNIKNDIQKGEGIILQIQMKPISDYWKGFHEESWQKIREGKDVSKKNGITDNVLSVIESLLYDGYMIMDSLMENEVKEEKINSNKQIKISDFSSSSRQKTKFDGFKVCIKLFIKTNSSYSANNYAISFQTSLMEVEEDNRLVMKKIKKKLPLTRGNLIEKWDLMSSKEVASLVNLPNQKLQRTFKIENVNIKQVNSPKECNISDGIKIGYMDYHGKVKNVFYPEDRDYLAMPKFYVAGMGAGKSNLLLNYADDVVRLKQSLIDINYVDKCQLAYAIKNRHKDHIVLNLADENNLPSFMFPEIHINDTDTPTQKKRKANNCAYEVKYIINSITTSNTEPISTRMSQYLTSACKLVFVYNGGKIKTVYDVLDDKKIRHEYVDRVISDGIFKEDDYEIRKLLELDDDKGYKKIEGILDRFCVLFENTTFQLMLESDDAKFNFTNIMDNNKSISICMPEREFRNKEEKDIIITYLMSRIRLAMLDRENKDKVCHVLLDEAHHLKKSLDVISDSIAEPRKYGVAFVFATHYFDQLGDRLKKASMSVGGHFILIKGVSETAYNELKSKIGDEYEYEDIKSMDDFNSFNMIWIRGQHYMFITHLPNILKDSNGKKYI